MKWTMIAEKSKEVFTPRRIKAGVVVLVICAVAGGSGAWYMHQQKAEQKARRIAAQTRLIQYQAAQKGMILIDESQARTLAAKAIGADENAVAFSRVMLENKKGYEDNEAKKDKDKKYAVDSHRQDVQGQVTVPVFNVAASVDGLQYNMEIHAVTGEVLQSKVTAKRIL